jgi:hypothetical protein
MYLCVYGNRDSSRQPECILYLPRPYAPRSHMDTGPDSYMSVVYYESRKREVKIRLINEGWCDERLKVRVEESVDLTFTGLHDKTN